MIDRKLHYLQESPAKIARLEESGRVPLLDALLIMLKALRYRVHIIHPTWH